MFWQVQPDNPSDGSAVLYEVFTGVLANLDVPNLVQCSHHIFVGDTRDGGASAWLRAPNQSGARPRRWLGHSEKSEEIPDGADWPGPIASLPDASVTSERGEVPLRCRCRGVDLVLRAPDREFEGKAWAELPWFVDPVTHKGIASFDVCNSCRIQSGTDIFHWTFALLRQIAFPRATTSAGAQHDSSNSNSNSPFPATTSELREAVTGGDPRFGTLALYASSPDVQRYFCSRCAAVVFYCVDDRPDMLDVALGLLEAPSGARAEEFVSWILGGDSAHREDMAGGWRDGHMNAVELAAEAWRVARKYPKHWRTVEKKEAAVRG
ncbi:hypothetical protein SLS62_001559 [Diatrype stigma]|uniref:CENP-V/GFA domain-containing protein n=1 Tax=Diatrype stigma TaxID=117547 RepID=A0AAN9YRJ8_9PEZI